MSCRAIFLDRDGTINRDVHHCHEVGQFELLPTVPEAINLLNHHGFKVIVITNQSAIARGYLTHNGLTKIHDRMLEILAKSGAIINGIYYCPHHPDDKCKCRKPATDLFEQAVKEHDINIQGSYMVGDMATDIKAGINAGCRTVLIANGSTTSVENLQYMNVKPDFIVENLMEAATWILSNEH